MIKIHPSSDVQSNNIGSGTVIWQFCVVLPCAKIGKNCNLNCHVFVENDVIIGDNVTIKPGVQIWDGLRIADNVFIGPNVTFTNDIAPRSKQYPVAFLSTKISNGASIGANATILTGLTIGKYSLIGAGSVVTTDVPPYTVYKGNPARKFGYITKNGVLLNKKLIDKKGNCYYLKKDEPIPYD